MVNIIPKKRRAQLHQFFSQVPSATRVTDVIATVGCEVLNPGNTIGRSALANTATKS